MNYHKLTYPDVNNGPGFRVTLWVSGCTHHCPHCQNKHTWDFNSGIGFTGQSKNRLFEILSLPYIQGLTISGGDPADSPEDILKLCEEVRALFPEKDIWLYTGYTMEQLQSDERRSPLLESGITAIVDGLYMEELRNVTLPYRGSSNQRIWVKQSDGGFAIISDEVFTNYI